ncbi:hypothetical protein AGMMS50296_5590 [Alphaproteobacteria bacterium]|nr:hypothetical protein AGMMS50296_5590 [Alphaproteobacteria bacterium]
MPEPWLTAEERRKAEFEAELEEYVRLAEEAEKEKAEKSENR